MAPAPPAPRRRSLRFWLLAIGGPLVFACLCLGILASAGNSSQTASATAQPSISTPIDTQPTDAPPAAILAPTSPAVAPTPATLSEQYLAIAKAGMTIPSARTASMPAGKWSATLIQAGDVSVTFPIDPGLDNAQTVRQGKRKIAQIVKALFDAVPDMQRVNVIGTLPDGANQTELAAVAIVIERAAFQQWDGTAETLGKWNVSP